MGITQVLAALGVQPALYPSHVDHVVDQGLFGLLKNIHPTQWRKKMSKCKCCGQQLPLTLNERMAEQEKQNKRDTKIMKIQREANKQNQKERKITFQDAPWSLREYVQGLPEYVCKTNRRE